MHFQVVHFCALHIWSVIFMSFIFSQPSLLSPPSDQPTAGAQPGHRFLQPGHVSRLAPPWRRHCKVWMNRITARSLKHQKGPDSPVELWGRNPHKLRRTSLTADFHHFCNKSEFVYASFIYSEEQILSYTKAYSNNSSGIGLLRANIQ